MKEKLNKLSVPLQLGVVSSRVKGFPINYWRENARNIQREGNNRHNAQLKFRGLKIYTHNFKFFECSINLMTQLFKEF